MPALKIIDAEAGAALATTDFAPIGLTVEGLHADGRLSLSAGAHYQPVEVPIGRIVEALPATGLGATDIIAVIAVLTSISQSRPLCEACAGKQIN